MKQFMVLTLRIVQHPVIKMRFLYNAIDESNGFFRCPFEKYVRKEEEVKMSRKKR